MQYLFALSGLLNGIISLFFSVLIISRNYRKKLYVLLSLLTLATAEWSFAYWQWLSVETNYNDALFWARVLSIGSTFIPLLYFHWILNLLEMKKRKLIIFAYLLTGFYLSFSFSSLFVNSVSSRHGFLFWPNPGPVYNLYLFTHYFFLVTYATYLLIANYRTAIGNKKLQIKYVLLGAFVGFGGGLFNFFLWFDINIPPAGNFLVCFYVVFFTYAIIKYRLMGIRLILSKFYSYTIIGAFSFALFHLVFIASDYLFGGVYTASGLVFGVIIALGFAVVLFPFLNYVQRSSDTLFFKGYNPRVIIKDLTIRLSSVIEINQLLKILAAEFKKILTTDEVGVIIFKKNGNGGRKNGKKEAFLISHSSLNWANLKADNKICLEAVKSKSVIVRSETKARFRDDPRNKVLIDEMDRNKVEVIAPLIIGGKITGLIILGEKISQEGYSQEDIEFLEIISSQAAVAIENALLYKEIGEMNKNLQKKVEEKTGELRKQNEYLEKLLIMRSEFLDIASHQLRTPVSVIKGMSSMILEGGLPPEKVNEFLKAILEKSNKLAEIINDILRASEMDSEKVLLKFTKVDVNKLLTKLVEDKQIQSKGKNITLSLSLPEKPLPVITADERYLEQAIGNLINNSFQYTPDKGRVDVVASVKGRSLGIRVKDTGIGIPKDDLPKLFSKFSRAKNAIAMYTDGTGLGLFIVKKIIEEHKGGKVIVEKTEEGKGTTFLITLAIA